MKITLEVAFEIGDFVYLRLNEQQRAGMITKFTVYPGGVMYCVSWGKDDTWHYAMELSTEYVPNFVS